MNEELQRWMAQYHEKFGDVFPTMSFMQDTVEEWIERIRNALDTGEKIKTLDNVVY